MPLPCTVSLLRLLAAASVRAPLPCHRTEERWVLGLWVDSDCTLPVLCPSCCIHLCHPVALWELGCSQEPMDSLHFLLWRWLLHPLSPLLLQSLARWPMTKPLPVSVARAPDTGSSSQGPYGQHFLEIRLLLP